VPNPEKGTAQGEEGTQRLWGEKALATSAKAVVIGRWAERLSNRTAGKKAARLLGQRISKRTPHTTKAVEYQEETSETGFESTLGNKNHYIHKLYSEKREMLWKNGY